MSDIPREGRAFDYYASMVAEQLVESDDHRILLCGSLTGHIGTPVALCDAPDIARVIRRALILSASHDKLAEALRRLLAANDAVENELCNGPEVPGFDPTALGRAQMKVTQAENEARVVLAALSE